MKDVGTSTMRHLLPRNENSEWHLHRLLAMMLTMKPSVILINKRLAAVYPRLGAVCGTKDGFRDRQPFTQARY